MREKRANGNPFARFSRKWKKSSPIVRVRVYTYTLLTIIHKRHVLQTLATQFVKIKRKNMSGFYSSEFILKRVRKFFLIIFFVFCFDTRINRCRYPKLKIACYCLFKRSNLRFFSQDDTIIALRVKTPKSS